MLSDREESHPSFADPRRRALTASGGGPEPSQDPREVVESWRLARASDHENQSAGFVGLRKGTIGENHLLNNSRWTLV